MDTPYAIQYFTLAHLVLALTTPTKALTAQVSAFGQACFHLPKVNGTRLPTLHLTFTATAADWFPPVAAKLVYQAHDLGVWRTEQGFTLRCGATTLALDLRTSCAVGWLAPTFWSCHSQDQRDFFLLTLLMLCHRHGLSGLHANGVCDGRHGYLLIGASGSGKTTLAMTLVRQGWRYLGDDVVLLQQTVSSVQAFALRRDFACTTPTLHHLKIQDAGAASSSNTAPAKRFVAGPTFHPEQFQPQMQPTHLLFARIGNGGASYCTRLAPTKALFALVQQSAGIMTERTVAQQQMALLTQLCRQAVAYELVLGSDLFTDPAAVVQLLQRL